MASVVTNEFVESLIDRSIDWAADTIKARLCVAGTPSKTATAMTGFTAATGSTDHTVGSKTVTKDNGTNRVTLGCADPAWTGVAHTGNATCIAFYKDGANDAARVPLVFHDVPDMAITGLSSIEYPIPSTGVAAFESQG